MAKMFVEKMEQQLKLLREFYRSAQGATKSGQHESLFPSFEAAAGVPARDAKIAWRRLCEDGLLEVEGEVWRLTPAGAKTVKDADAQPKVFVSHSANDRALAKAFVECVEGCLEMPDRGLRCTSVPGYELAPGDVSDEVLRENLEQCSVVIGLLTDESLKSGYVIMELGAAWGLKKTTCALLAPSVEFKRVPGPLARTHAVMVDKDHSVASVMDVIAQKTGWPQRNRTRSTAAVSSFVSVAKATP